MVQQKSGITLLDLVKIYKEPKGRKQDGRDQEPTLFGLDFRGRLQPVAMTNFESTADISTLLLDLERKRLSREEIASLRILNLSDNNLMKDDLLVLLEIIENHLGSSKGLTIVFSNNRLYECTKTLSKILALSSVSYFDVTLNPVVSQASFAELLREYKEKIVCVQHMHVVRIAVQALHRDRLDNATLDNLQSTHKKFYKNDFSKYSAFDETSRKQVQRMLRKSVSGPEDSTSADNKQNEKMMTLLLKQQRNMSIGTVLAQVFVLVIVIVIMTWQKR
jgi:hypothetical protein